MDITWPKNHRERSAKQQSTRETRYTAKCDFGNDMRYHPIPPREQQPRKNVLRTIDGHIVVPIPPS